MVAMSLVMPTLEELVALVDEEALPVKAPTKPVAVKTPVEGLNVNFVLEIFVGALPLVAVLHVGYTATLLVVSFVIPTLIAFVAVVAVVAFPVNAPTNVVADSAPVDGLNVSLVLATLPGLSPELAVTNTG